MPVIVDGFPLDNTGRVRLSVRRLALNIIAAQEVAAPPETKAAAETTAPTETPAAAQKTTPEAAPPPPTPDKAPA